MSDRKAQILETAAELLMGKSFKAFSYQDLADRLGITKASLHHHFPTKEDLGLSLLEYYEDNSCQAIEAVLGSHSSPGEIVAAYLDMSEEVLIHGTIKVCPIEAFDVDGPGLPDRLTDRLKAMVDDRLGQFAELLEGARAAGEIQFLGDPRAQAALIHCSLKGARGLARMLGIEAFRDVVGQIKRSLGLSAGD